MMRRIPGIIAALLSAAQAGCLTTGFGPSDAAAAAADAGPPAVVRAVGPETPPVGQPRTDPSPPTPPNLPPIRWPVPVDEPLQAAQPAKQGERTSAILGMEGEGEGTTDPTVFTFPVPVQTCAVEPVLQLMTGTADPQTRLTALSTIALMGATFGLRAACQTSGDSSHAQHIRHIGANVDDLLQPPSANQSDVDRARRPPYIFTLGWRY